MIVYPRLQTWFSISASLNMTSHVNACLAGGDTTFLGPTKSSETMADVIGKFESAISKQILPANYSFQMDSLLSLKTC